MRVLRQGSQGREVIALQERLKRLHFSPGLPDGIFGPATRAAVVAYQRSEGLLADGVVGPGTARALGLDPAAEVASAIPHVTVGVVARMFPFTPRGHIERNLPVVLEDSGLTDRTMVLVALATIRAEVESFEPLRESPSRFNTSPGGAAFDLYDYRRDLGNQGPPDGERYRGRGFVQLTGRANYRRHGAAIGLGERLVEDPELASDAANAAKLLASFLGSKERGIKEALLEGDLKGARRLVNGGAHGLERFAEAYEIGTRLIPDDLRADNDGREDTT